MKYVILLFVLVSLFGFNDASAASHVAENDLEIYFDESAQAFMISYNFESHYKCAVYVGALNDSYYYPNVKQFGNGSIEKLSYGIGYGTHTVEVVDCKGTLSMPVSDFNDQTLVNFQGSVFGYGNPSSNAHSFSGIYTTTQQTSCASSFNFKNCIITNSTGNKTTGSSDNRDRIPPTLGLGESVRIVDNGFTFNGESINVEYFHTNMTIHTTVNQTNTIELLIYDNWGTDKIDGILIGLGLENIKTLIYNAENLIDIELFNTKVEKLTVVDDQNLLYNWNVTTTDHIKCSERDMGHADCLKVTFTYQNREAGLYNVIAIKLSDEYGNDSIFYINDGIAVTGESLNPPMVKTISGVEYTRTDKVNNTWIDEEGIEFEETKGGWMLRTTPWN